MGKSSGHTVHICEQRVQEGEDVASKRKEIHKSKTQAIMIAYRQIKTRDNIYPCQKPFDTVFSGLGDLPILSVSLYPKVTESSG